ncbi:hypothetical protein HNQ80_005072 [Anaerosolibacter carboniphilus]|uniref:Immune inhibitor A peptidase M6 n=1 Tax=Anaerosolibacter carboniphilus TaxID=1417629 RepID=A0A841KZV4_9FIRM|nr:immune inhibitor A domain-containing protein [Anaerosolibacter carboniphilus]MBB6218897.1 hypothetical protein [Anaerosolibacter carboniphilus]
MKRKILSIVTACTLILSVAMPANLVKAQAAEKGFDTTRYGDTIDIGGKLRSLENNEEFMKEAEKKMKESAKGINFDEEEGAADENQSSNFTFDGGTKYFLNYELGFKEFTLRSQGENVEVWVANDLSFPDDRPAHIITQEQVDRMKDTFEEKVYLTDTAFFGTPDSHDGSNSTLAELGYVPEGYYVSEDGSDKVIILVDNIIDEQYYDPTYPFFVAGFYWGTLERYIDRNIITIDSKDWNTRLETTFLPTTAHEFQHLIHADNDPDEETWINEGMSDFAEYLCFGEHAWGHVNYFLDHPENSLIEWDEYYSYETGPETLADYGQAYLMQVYLNDHYGKEFVKALAQDEDNGISSVNKILKAFKTGIDFEELFRRFTIAVAIDSSQPQNGIYNFESIDLHVNYEKALEFDKDGVPAWGGDYKVLDNAEKIRSIIFDGTDFLSSPWKVVEKDGKQVLWGNGGDEKSNQIILKADLKTVTDEVYLAFDHYYDIEEQWDFGIVQVSEDDGQTWKSLANENTRSDIVDEGYPTIKENIPGFTGSNHDWTSEQFDLAPYAGKEILINFNYMTDWGTTEEGWYIDNISIPAIGYENDCSSIEGLYSIDQINKKYVDYAVTFINEKELGKGSKASLYKVVNVDPFNVSEDDALELKQLFSEGKNYMIIWFAAPEGTKGTVNFTYEILTKSESKKGRKSNVSSETNNKTNPSKGKK